eukprot:20233-Heterococcus_DN1.PRE.5
MLYVTYLRSAPQYPLVLSAIVSSSVAGGGGVPQHWSARASDSTTVVFTTSVLLLCVYNYHTGYGDSCSSRSLVAARKVAETGTTIDTAAAPADNSTIAVRQPATACACYWLYVYSEIVKAADVCVHTEYRYIQFVGQCRCSHSAVSQLCEDCLREQRKLWQPSLCGSQQQLAQLEHTDPAAAATVSATATTTRDASTGSCY